MKLIPLIKLPPDIHCKKCGHKLLPKPNSILGILYILFGEIDVFRTSGGILVGLGIVLGFFFSYPIYFLSISGIFLLVYSLPKKAIIKDWGSLLMDAIIWTCIFLFFYMIYYIMFFWSGGALTSSVGIGGTMRFIGLCG